jgi:uncharacterized protein (TIGR02453 family)
MEALGGVPHLWQIRPTMKKGSRPKAKSARRDSSITDCFRVEAMEFVSRAGRQKRPDWLERNREEYEVLVLQPLKEIAARLKRGLAKDAPGYHFPQQGIGRLKRTAASAAEYGFPFRDYLTYSARRPSESRFDKNPSLFLMVYPDDEEGDEVLLAGGLYMPSSRQLRPIREAIATNAAPFERLFRSAAFSASFPGGFSQERKATRPPRGFDPEHPRLDWLKLQGFFVWRSYSKREYSKPGFSDLLVRDAKQALRLNELLDQAIAGRWVSEVEGRGARGKASLSDALETIQALPTKRRKMDF